MATQDDGEDDNTRNQAGVTQERASYFATGGQTNRQRRSRVPVESWPGYYNTARELSDNRSVAQARRQQQLEQQEKDAEKPTWVPRKKPRTSVLTPMHQAPSLQKLSLDMIATYIDQMPTLEYLDPASRHRVASVVIEQRRMKSEVLPLFIFPGVSEIDIPDCSNVEEVAMLDALQKCQTDDFSLTTLRLGMCGRCVNDRVISELGQSLTSVELLSLRGCYRLSDAGMETLVRQCAPSLRVFEISCDQRLTRASINHLAELEHLEALTLAECPQMTDESLQALLKMNKLRKLTLDQMENISDAFVADLASHLPQLEELSLARCPQLTDKAVRSVLEHCQQLRVLDVSGLHLLTDDSFEPIRRLGHSLRRVSIRGCLGMTDAGVEHLAVGAHKFLQVLEMSSLSMATDASLKALEDHCTEGLHALDVSFCRKLSEDGLGLFIDKAKALTSLVLWGCTQISARLLTCHAQDDLVLSGHPLLTGLTLKH